MHLICVGINHHTAPLAVRERFAFGPHRRRELLHAVRTSEFPGQHGLAELALLSTCNRTELYGVARSRNSTDRAPQRLAALLAQAAHEPLGLLAPHIYAHGGETALTQLCRVAAGLDSMVVGEAEILGQVAEARREAEQCGTSGPRLDAVFRTAMLAGRRARAETAIGRRSSSVASEAVRLIAARIPSLPDCRFAVIGSGQLARLVTRILADGGAHQIALIGRSLEHASTASARTPATPRAWHHLPETLGHAEVMICTTGAPHAVVTRDLLLEARRSSTRELLIIDLAVPRDVDPSVANLPGVTLVDLDTIQARVEDNLRARAADTPQVERIISEALQEYQSWCRAEELRPALAALRRRAEAIRAHEVDRAHARLGVQDAVGRELLEEFSRGLVTRILDTPSRRLRSETDEARQAVLAEALRALFDLDDADAIGDAS